MSRTRPLTAWRLIKTKLAARAFDGEGARLFGGRWNSPGTTVVYASEHASLALLEVLVHLQASPMLERYSLARVTFAAERVESLAESALPPDWRAHPAPFALAELGDRWVVEARSAVLVVPSVIVPGERNYLLNPRHPDARGFHYDAPEPFALDVRLASG